MSATENTVTSQPGRRHSLVLSEDSALRRGRPVGTQDVDPHFVPVTLVSVSGLI